MNTFGSIAARSASASTTQSAIGCRALFRISTTSNAVHAAAPASTSSIGRGAEVAPAVLRRAVDHHRVTAAGLADEAHALDPLHPCLHRLPVSRTSAAPLRRQACRRVRDRCTVRRRCPSRALRVQRCRTAACGCIVQRNMRRSSLSAFEEPPPLRAGHSSILLLWWNPRGAAPTAAPFFARPVRATVRRSAPAPDSATPRAGCCARIAAAHHARRRARAAPPRFDRGAKTYYYSRLC